MVEGWGPKVQSVAAPLPVPASSRELPVCHTLIYMWLMSDESNVESNVAHTCVNTHMHMHIHTDTHQYFPAYGVYLNSDLRDLHFSRQFLSLLPPPFLPLVLSVPVLLLELKVVCLRP